MSYLATVPDKCLEVPRVAGDTWHVYSAGARIRNWAPQARVQFYSISQMSEGSRVVKEFAIFSNMDYF